MINFAWTFQLPPPKIFLQVICTIGFSMIALAILLWLPRWLLVVLTVLLIAGHNLLDTLHFPTDHFMHIYWAVLHDREWIEITDSIKARTSYPILPWIGLIIFGYLASSWFT
uniref:Heparan-alpha-glucosaminide N-acetyltransferase catalytic domain-containing protein n=1 Tax=Arsenophonus endosymbiont of Trialeurodes vaporariorum TaxID=235567 RepID=A0A3B0LY44_9GAMM